VLIYDPVFDEEDVTGLKELGFEVLSSVAESQTSHTTLTPRLLFLPHCELWLYESIMGANWTPGSLPSLFMISNRFHTYSDKYAIRLIRQCMIRIIQQFADEGNAELVPLCLEIGYVDSNPQISNIVQLVPAPLAHTNMHLAPLLKCLPIPDSPIHETAFTELALQFIDLSKWTLPSHDDEFWALSTDQVDSTECPRFLPPQVND
jgi:hypothetical protein